MGRISNIWTDEYRVTETKWVRALGSDYILFVREPLPKLSEHAVYQSGARGLYYAKVDFSAIETNDDLTLVQLIDENKKPIVEVSTQYGLYPWDAKGNDHILAVAYTQKFDEANHESWLKALTSSAQDFQICDHVVHAGRVSSVEVIVPFADKERAYALYGTVGLDGSKH